MAKALDIVEPTVSQTYMAHRKDVTLSSYGARFVAALRSYTESVARNRVAHRKQPQVSSRYVFVIDAHLRLQQLPSRSWESAQGGVAIPEARLRAAEAHKHGGSL
jgi:hypothetical protein